MHGWVVYLFEVGIFNMVCIESMLLVLGGFLVLAFPYLAGGRVGVRALAAGGSCIELLGSRG